LSHAEAQRRKEEREKNDFCKKSNDRGRPLRVNMQFKCVTDDKFADWFPVHSYYIRKNSHV